MSAVVLGNRAMDTCAAVFQVIVGDTVIRCHATHSANAVLRCRQHEDTVGDNTVCNRGFGDCGVIRVHRDDIIERTMIYTELTSSSPDVHNTSPITFGIRRYIVERGIGYMQPFETCTLYKDAALHNIMELAIPDDDRVQ